MKPEKGGTPERPDLVIALVTSLLPWKLEPEKERSAESERGQMLDIWRLRTVLSRFSRLKALPRSSQLLRTQHLGQGPQSGLLDHSDCSHHLLGLTLFPAPC